MRFQRHVIPLFPGRDALGVFALGHRQSCVAEEHTQRRLGGIDDSEQRGCSRFRIAWRGCRAEGTDAYAFSRDRMTAAVTQLLDAAAKSGAIRSDFDPQDVLLAVAASTWTFVNDGDWEERALRVLRLVMDGLRYKPR